MKKIILASSLIVLTFASFAQKIKVAEATENIGGGKNNALVVTIYQATPDAVEKEVKSRLKDYNAKVSSKDGGWFGDNAVIKKMGNNTIDVYAKWEPIRDGETKLVMAFDLGGAFLSSSKQAEYNVAKDIVHDIAVKTTADAVAALVKQQQKAYDKLSDEQKRLEKENKGLNDDIANYRQKIEDNNQKIKKAQDDIETNKSNQGKKKEEIAEQQKVLDSAKDKQKIVD